MRLFNAFRKNRTTRSQSYRRSRRIRFEQLEARQMLTAAVAYGDFNGDGYEDLAIGNPTADVWSVAQAGKVEIYHGSASGLPAGPNQVWHQDVWGVKDVAERWDHFGSSLAAGDFDGDGCDDLAIGVPGEDIGSIAGAGAVNILYGSSSGLSTRDQFWHQDRLPFETAEAYDHFGELLTAGDFDGDGCDDLAIGVPDDHHWVADPGGLNVLYGSSSGITASGSFYLMVDVKALAAGDFNGDGCDELAIGRPHPFSGAVTVLRGTDSGLTTSYQQFFQAGYDGVLSNGGDFGRALAAGDFNTDGFDDLAIGVPYEDVGSVYQAGTVNVLYGSLSYLTVAGNQLWHQDSPGVPGEANQYVSGFGCYGDNFGRSLAAGDFDGDGYDDLAIGVPFEKIGSVYNAGAVNVLYGSYRKLTSNGAQYWHQDVYGVPGEPGGFARALAAGDFNGDGKDDLAVGNRASLGNFEVYVFQGGPSGLRNRGYYIQPGSCVWWGVLDLLPWPPRR